MTKTPNQYVQNGQYAMHNPPPQQQPQSYNPPQQQPQPYNVAQQQTQSFSQSGAQFSGPPGQGYGNNPNYQYYIGNNANK